MKLRRDIASVPLRTGAETWARIIALITSTDSVDADQLTSASSVMAMLLSEEHYAEHPLTMKGEGHRLVIYCAYGAGALALGDEVASIDWTPTKAEWTLFVPCPDEDIDWATTTLAKRAPRIKLHKLDETPSELKEEAAASARGYEIDWNAAE